MTRAITEKLVSKQKQVTPTGSTAAKDPVTETAGWATFEKKVPIEAKKADKGGTLRTLEGPARYSAGDFIARGAKGEKWPIRKDVFVKTYKKVGPAHGAGFAKAANIRDQRVSTQDAHEAAAAVGAAGRVSLTQLRRGMQVELEHSRDPETDVIKGDPKALARTAWAHLKERGDYYDVLEKAEKAPEKAPSKTAEAMPMRRVSLGRRGATSRQLFGQLGPRAASGLGRKSQARGFARQAVELLARRRAG